MNKLLLSTILVSASVFAAPIVISGPSPTAPDTSGLDLEWSARARNFDNRPGTWKLIVFGDDLSTNNGNSTTNFNDWTISNNLVAGTFSLIFTSTGGPQSPNGLVYFTAGGNFIQDAPVGVDADTNDGGITDLVIFLRTGSPITLAGLNINGVAVPNMEILSGTDPSLYVHIGNLGGTDFTLTGRYRVDVPGPLADEAPRFEFRAYSSQVPEPSTYALMVAGLGALAYARRRR
jgi:hypothetical protein